MFMGIFILKSLSGAHDIMFNSSANKYDKIDD